MHALRRISVVVMPATSVVEIPESLTFLAYVVLKQVSLPCRRRLVTRDIASVSKVACNCVQANDLR